MTDHMLPPDPRVSGWHWIASKTGTEPLFWSAEWMLWARGSTETSPRAAVALGWRYLCPVPSPERIAGLEAVAKAAIGEALAAKLGETP